MHSKGYISDLFAKADAELIQRREHELGTGILTHQKVCVYCISILERIWGGADNGVQRSTDCVDNLMKTVTVSVSSTMAMGKGVMEAQFAKSKLWWQAARRILCIARVNKNPVDAFGKMHFRLDKMRHVNDLLFGL